MSAFRALARTVQRVAPSNTMPLTSRCLSVPRTGVWNVEWTLGSLDLRPSYWKPQSSMDMGFCGCRIWPASLTRSGKAPEVLSGRRNGLLASLLSRRNGTPAMAALTQWLRQEATLDRSHIGRRA